MTPSAAATHTGGVATARGFRAAGISARIKPNWGRLIAVAGRAGVAFDAQRAKVTLGSIVLFENGRPYDDRAPQAASYLKAAWTCDLSAEYVKINAEYRT